MSVLATADLFIKPDRVDELMQLLREALPDTRAYEGCEGLDTFVDQDDPGHILFVERWTARTAHEAYLAWREEQGMFDVLADYISAPPQFQYFDPRADV